MSRPVRALALVAVLALASGCGAASATGLRDPGSRTTPTATATATTSAPAPTTSTTTTSAPAPAAGTALAALATLEIKGRAPRTGYDRDLFGPSWADTDRNGCDTRNDVLRRDLVGVALDPRTNGCVVLTGTLTDPFSGRDIAFVRGETTSRAVQVDHVVALSDAWQKGAQQWTPARRLAFANDPLGLLAVDGDLNAQKSDGDAATWLPPDRSFRCAYVARQVAVKAKFGLWVTAAEHDAITRVLGDCPDEPLPASDHPTESDLPVWGTPTATAAPAPAPAPAAGLVGGAAGCDPAYPGVCIPPVSAGGDLDCGQVPHRRFAVLPPDPHRFDGDGNGVGCESG